LSKSKRIKIFITYSHSDSTLSEKLARDLRANELEAFFDVDSIKGGDRIAETISRGLADCDIYVPILSFKALESPWCRDEINAAIALSNDSTRNGRPKILSVLAEDCRSAMWPLLLGRLYFSFEGDYDAALKELVERGLGLGVSAVVSPTKTIVRRAAIQSVRAEFEAEKKGALIHLVVTIDGYRDAQCKAAAYFCDSHGNPLKDIDDKFRSGDGSVSTGTEFTPGYDEAEYKDLQLFIPYSQFHLAAGHHELSFYVLLWDLKDTSKSLASSSTTALSYDRLPTVINQVWVDYNVILGKVKTMVIHVDFDIGGHKDEECKVLAYFYNEDGTPLTDIDDKFTTTAGQVCADTDLKPTFPDSHYGDLRILIPNDQIHTSPGEGDYKFFVEIHDAKGKNLSKSTWSLFSVKG